MDALVKISSGVVVRKGKKGKVDFSSVLDPKNRSSIFFAPNCESTNPPFSALTRPSQTNDTNHQSKLG